MAELTMQEKIENMVKRIDPVNAEYIMADHRFESKVESVLRYDAKKNTEMVNYMLVELRDMAQEFNEKNLTPANVKVGDGVTMHMYSDAHAGTVIKVTKTSVTIQRDDATLSPEFKPEFVVGGFAGHCTNQSDQRYTYEQNKNGSTMTFRWSKKYNRFQDGKTGRSLTKGRREFYDYNF
jgi:hypothetical protein